MNKRVGILALVATLVTSMAIATVSACDTRTPGYWKTHHPEDWPTTDTTYPDFRTGPRTYNIPEDAIDTLWSPVRGDARTNLEQKVIAAELSILADQRDGWGWWENYVGGPMGGATLIALVDEANALLAAHAGPWTPGSLADESGVRAQGLALAGAIDYWLNYFDMD